MSEQLFSVVGTAINPKGELKMRWANDLMQRIGILIKAECADINLHDAPKLMSKLDAAIWLKENTELTPEQLEVVDFKIYDLKKAKQRADKKADIIDKVVNGVKENKKTDTRVTDFIKKTITNKA